MKIKTNKPMMHIGTSKKTVRAARNAILKIMASACGDTVKETALKAFTQVCRVRNVEVSHCSFTTKTK